MKTKGAVFLFLSIVFFGAIMIVNFFVLDNSNPSINVKQLPVVACDITKDDLLSYASATDDKLKTFFIEENDITDIVDSKKVTFVAIDESNNITKKSVSLDVNDSLQRYHIEAIKELKLQVNDNFVVSDYFVLKNACGQIVEGKLSIQGLNNKKIGVYNVIVSSIKYPVEQLEDTFIVDDFTKPKISLNESVLRIIAGKYYNDEYFMEFIDKVSDDVDDEEYLLENIDINWRDILKPDENGCVNDVGNYYVTYTISDSDGNSSSASLQVIIEAKQEILED